MVNINEPKDNTTQPFYLDKMRQLMKIRKNGVTNYLISLIVWYLFIGLPLLIFLSKILGFYFHGFSSLITFVLFLLLLVTNFDKIKINMVKVTYILVYLIPIIIGAILSNKAGEPYWVQKVLITVFYVFIPMIFSLVINTQIYDDPVILPKLALYSIPFEIFFIIRSAMSSSGWFVRVGSSANAIYFSYSVVNTFLILSCFLIKDGEKTLAIVLSIIGITFSFVLGTRQVVVYAFIFVILLFVWIRKYTNLWLSSKGVLSIRYKNLVIVVLVCLIALLLALSNVPRILNILKSAAFRWEIVKNPSEALWGRERTWKIAFDVIRQRPIFGNFAYEDPGFWAHNMLLDAASQFGLFFFIIFFFSVLASFVKSLSLLTQNRTIYGIHVFIFMYFLSVLPISFTMSTFLFRPDFNFALFTILFFSVKSVTFKRKVDEEAL